MWTQASKLTNVFRTIQVLLEKYVIFKRKAVMP